MDKLPDWAFPQEDLRHCDGGAAHRISGGLTKREYFAGQALMAHFLLNRHVHFNDIKAANIAIDAVTCADALIKELEK